MACPGLSCNPVRKARREIERDSRVQTRFTQRLMAHKVAQYHGLQTSTADYEGTTGRVVAHRKSVETKVWDGGL